MPHRFLSKKNRSKKKKKKKKKRWRLKIKPRCVLIRPLCVVPLKGLHILNKLSDYPQRTQYSSSVAECLCVFFFF